MEDIEGPINACSNGVVSSREIIHFIEENTGIKPLVQEVGDHVAPYNEVTNCTLHNGKANELGFPFRELKIEIEKYYVITYMQRNNHKSPVAIRGFWRISTILILHYQTYLIRTTNVL